MADDVSFAKLGAGIVGAAVSLKFVQGTWAERVMMCIGGSALSYYGTTPLATWVAAPDAEGLIGFFIGLFGMAIVAKVYEVVMLIDAKKIAEDVWSAALEWLKRKWGA